MVWFMAELGTGAQAIPESLLVAGTTTLDATGRPWGYVVIRASDESVLRGRTFSIYRKRGLPGDAGAFERLGGVAPERDPTVLSVLLERGRQVGDEVASLESALFELYRARLGGLEALGEGQPEPVNPGLARVLGALLARGDADTETARLMRWLGQGHAGVRMALGEAWAGPLGVAPGQPVTLEIRERDFGGAGDGAVVGRVVLTAGQPVLLPPPGPPVQVPDLTPKGDLNIKLRWGQDEALRRQAPLATGFGVWRVLRTFAASHGVEGAAPSLRQLRDWAASGDASRIGEGPVLTSRALSLVEASDLAADGTTYFVVDDGNRYRKNPAGEDADLPLIEGTEFTYFVTARDLLGRDGPPSMPGHGVVCRTLPPPVPGGLRAENHWAPDTGVGGVQSIRFQWQANLDTARDVTHFYEVYRGTNLTELQSEAARSVLVPVNARVDQEGPGGAELSVIDEAPEVVGAGFGHTFWYSVRAVHLSPCGPIRSDFAAPVLIARRQREGPPAPSGFVDANCHRAAVIFEGEGTTSDPSLPANDGRVRLRVWCGRRDPGVAMVDLSIQVEGRTVDLGNHVYAAEGNWVAADYDLHRNELPSRTVAVRVVAWTYSGARSPVKEVRVDHLTSEGLREVRFAASTLGDGDLVPGEPFSMEWLEPPVNAPVAVFPDGTGVARVGAALEGRRVVLETSLLAAAVPIYEHAGHGTVRDGDVHFRATEASPGEPVPPRTARVYPVRDLGDGDCVDLAYHPGTGSAGTLGITLLPTKRSEEYRLFRRIDDGPYTLVGQGAVSTQNETVAAVRREDSALPATDCTVCYYAQTVDRDGNGSALVRLEPCVQRRSPTLPKPSLAPPEATGTSTAAVMRLTWMCPPQGVERFLISIRARGGAAAQSRLEQAATLSMAAPLAARVVQYFSAADGGPMETSARAADVGSAGQGPAGDRARVLQSAVGSVIYRKMVVTSSFVTPRLGDGYPADPPYTAEFVVEPGMPYEVYVQAVRGPLLGGQGRGPASGRYEFRWEEPRTEEPAVAWPARPLEMVTAEAGLEAGELSPVVWPGHLAGERPVGVRLARMANTKGEDVVVTPTDVVFAPTPDSPAFRKHDPNAHLLGGLSDGVTQVQSVMLYRQQVANTLFPAVPGDTVQVSPLIRKIAWVPVTTDDGRRGARLVDPFFGLTLVAPPPQSPDVPATLDLWLLDTQGVVEGARYHYYLVCFGADGEIRRTLDAGYSGPP